MTLTAHPITSTIAMDDNEFYVAVLTLVLASGDVSQSDVARALGVYPSYLSKWLRTDSRQRINSKHYDAIRRLYPRQCLEVANRLRASGAVYEPFDKYAIHEGGGDGHGGAAAPADSLFVNIPVVTNVYCAEHAWQPSLVDAIDLRHWEGAVAPAPNDGRRYIAMRAVGQSNAPDIHPGDILICHVDSRLEECTGKLVLVVYGDGNGGELVIAKDLVAYDPATLYLSSRNPAAAQDIRIPRATVRVAWRVHQRVVTY